MFDIYLPCSLCLFYTIINPRYSPVFGRLVSYRVVRRQRDVTLWSDPPMLLSRGETGVKPLLLLLLFYTQSVSFNS
jgi:hypothetical protein